MSKFGCAVLAALTALCCIPPAYAAKPFTVDDWIDMVEPSIPTSKIELLRALPEGQSANDATQVAPADIAAVIQRADRQSGLNELSLVSFSGQEVRDFIADSEQSKLPAQHLLARFQTARAGQAITDLSWFPAQRQLAFRGFRRETDDKTQVYLYDVTRHELRQLTHHPDSIESFSLSLTAQTLVYSASTVPERDGGKRHRYVVGAGQDARNDSSALAADPARRPLLQYFAMDLRSGKVTSIRSTELQPAFARPLPVYISPSGRWAVRYAQPGMLPIRWSEYVPVRQLYGPESWQPLGWQSAQEAVGWVPHSLYQFQLMDLRTGVTRPLIDAPTEIFSTTDGTGEDGPVAWSANEDQVYLAETYLPLTGLSGEERTKRAQSRTIAAVDLRSGEITQIDELTDPRGSQAPSLRLDRDGQLAYRKLLGTGLKLNTLVQRYRQSGSSWTRQAATQLEGDRLPAGNADIAPRSFFVRRSDNVLVAPEWQVIDRSTGRSREITRLNPRMDEFEMGQLETFRWTDRHGASWEGALLRPSGQKPGQAMPVLIQLYAWQGKDHGTYRLMMEGNPGALLMQKGIAVLQAQCIGGQPPEWTERYQRNPDVGVLGVVTTCLDGAAEALVAQGVAEPGRIALAGHSAQGNRVMHAITFGRAHYATALVSDAVQTSLWNYLLYYGGPAPGMGYWDQTTGDSGSIFVGAPFLGEGIERWKERSPLFSLDRIRSPILFEYHDASATAGYCGCWDSYTILKRAQRPVELAWYPDDLHVLTRVAERYLSREAALDWFAFWLKDEEDPSPQKASQYERWRLLRRQQHMHLAQMADSPESTGSAPSH